MLGTNAVAGSVAETDMPSVADGTVGDGTVGDGTVVGATTATPQPTPIPVRRVDLDESFADLPKHFATDGNIFQSHMVAVMSSVFPDGEDFFVRSVRYYRDQITDPVLAKEVAGFIGQESIHGREHRTFNRHLARLGYPTERLERFTKRGLAARTKVAPPLANLAATAALEHFTATLAEEVLGNPEARRLVAHEGVHDLFLWHALEEAEHKAVAFDVFRAMGGSERLRVFTMKTTRIGFVVGMGFQTIVSLLGDPAARDLRRLRRDWRVFRRSPLMSRRVWQTLKAYDRPNFHPNDTGTPEVVAAWRDELFGENGSMVRYLPQRAA